MCRLLRKPSIPVDMACAIVSTSSIDQIMYSIVGFQRVRASIFGLMNPRTSIITKSQVHAYKLVESWEPALDSHWLPLALVGADFAEGEGAGIADVGRGA